MLYVVHHFSMVIGSREAATAGSDVFSNPELTVPTACEMDGTRVRVSLLLCQ